jgi:hypothetical protein
MSLQVEFQEYEDVFLPVFRPALSPTAAGSKNPTGDA